MKFISFNDLSRHRNMSQVSVWTHLLNTDTPVGLCKIFTPSLFSLQEIEVGGNRKAIIIFVPVPQLKSFQKIQVRLVRELEKKFSGKHVVFIAQVRRRRRRMVASSLSVCMG